MIYPPLNQVGLIWVSVFGDNLPAGFLLRQSATDRWVRLHSLSNAKRYPTTTSEREQILNRQNEIATRVLGDESKCIMFRAQRSNTPHEALARDSVSETISFEHALTFWNEQDGGDYYLFYSAAIMWREKHWDEILTAIADDKLNSSLIVANLTRGNVFAPYDGGVDLFFSKDCEARDAALRWAKWLSARPDGL